MDRIEDFAELQHKDAAPVTAAQASAGLPLSKARVLRVMSADDWEEFIEEWLGHRRANGPYGSVRRYGGAGDLGLDLVAFTGADDFDSPWDSFQAKHYDEMLAPHHVYVEIGKIIYHSFKKNPPYNKKHQTPRKHYFVAPRGVGTKLSHLLGDPDRLKEAMREEWESKCQDEKIGKGIIAKLEGDLLDYFKSFDFSVFDEVLPADLISEHAETPHHVARFGGALPPRPAATEPPPIAAANESVYLAKLFETYSEVLGRPVPAEGELRAADESLHKHYSRQRELFYCAESLRAYSRETFTPGTFEDLQEEVHAGIIDTVEGDHDSGLKRLRRTVTVAGTLNVSGHALSQVSKPRDKQGICHQLANVDRITWVSAKSD